MQKEKLFIIFSSLLSVVACTNQANNGLEQKETTFTKPDNIQIDVRYQINKMLPSKKAVDYLVKTARDVVNTPYKSVKIVGFTDNTGYKYTNILLSHRRAESIQNIFLRNGIEKEKMVSYGLGAINPIFDCSLIQRNNKNYLTELKRCHNQNRRVEISIDY